MKLNFYPLLLLMGLFFGLQRFPDHPYIVLGVFLMLGVLSEFLRRIAETKPNIDDVAVKDTKQLKRR